MSSPYSYSRLETFKQCPRKYAYQYIEKPDIEKQESVEAHLGTVCHETVQQIYKDLNLSKLMTLEETLSFYDECWEKDKPPSLRIVRERYSEDNYKVTGREYVRTFYESYQPFRDGRTLGIEKQVQIKLGEEILMTGYIDRLVDHGKGSYEIVDYKTNRELPVPADLEGNWQLPLYQIGLSQMFPDMKEFTCTWHFLAHNKRISLRKTDSDLDKIKADIRTLVSEIKSTSEFEPRTSALCSWCDYQSICPAQKHIVECENLTLEEFKNDDGVRLVDSYMEVERSVSEMKAKLEDLKERIYNYGLRNHVNLLRGSSERIKIWSKKDAVKLVSKEENPSAAEEIRKILVRHGLWDEFSSVSQWELGKAIESRSLPEEVFQELAPFVKRTLVRKLYPGKLQEKS